MAELGPFATRHAPTAMVSTVDHLATQAGIELLRRGGSAADAAIGANAVLAVTCPHLCGMGGDLFALVHTADGPPHVLNASGRAGSGADPERLRSEGATRMPFTGDVRSAPVPGCVDGWAALHEKFGRLDLAEVLEPARRLAAGGFPVGPLLAQALPIIQDVQGAGDLTKRAFGHGDRCTRADLAATLEAVAKGGRDAFYLGAFGEALVEVGQGEYTAGDLEHRHADWVDPLGLRVWGHDLWTVPPNSQGYLTLASAWIAERLPLPAGRFGPDGPDDPQWAHLLVEAARQAGFDRPALLHEHADGNGLVAEPRLSPRLAAIDPATASTVPDPSPAPGDTMLLCAVDGDRMGVSLIQSNAAGFGCHVAVPGTGVLLHNRGIGFTLEAGHPAEYGAGRRPPHTLSPALVTRPDGSLRACVGTMGGDSQPQILLQVLARLLHNRQRPGTCISAPRWVLTRPTGRGFDIWDDAASIAVAIEADAPDAWAEGLRHRGHQIVAAPRLSHGHGHAHLIEVDATHGLLGGAADPRAQIGAASGY